MVSDTEFDMDFNLVTLCRVEGVVVSWSPAHVIRLAYPMVLQVDQQWTQGQHQRSHTMLLPTGVKLSEAASNECIPSHPSCLPHVTSTRHP